MHIVHHETEATGKKSFQRPNEIRMKQGPGSAGGKTPSKQGSAKEQDEEEAETSMKLDPNQCRVGTDHTSVMAVERDFWARWQIHEAKLIGGTQSTGTGIVASVISTNSRLAVFGMSNGYVLVYDLNDEPA